MKIIELQAENFKKLKAVKITPKGNLVEISGANGSGKSSILDAIFTALSGAGSIPQLPVREGEQQAKIKLKLGDIIVTRTISADGKSQLKVESRGDRISSPQSLLDSLVGELTFDPFEFSQMSKKAQYDELRRIVPLSVDIDQMRLNDQADYDERHLFNVEIRDLEGQIAGIPEDKECPEQLIDSGDLASQLNEISKHNSAVAAAKQKRQSLEQEIKDDAVKFDRQIETLQSKRNGYQAEIERLLKQVEETEQQEQVVSEAHVKASKQKLAELNLIAIEDEKDTSDITRQIAAVTDKNEHIRLQQARKQKIKRAEALAEKSKELTDRMAQRRILRDKALASAKMPVEGLGFGDGFVTFKGFPFEQASSAEQLRVSIAIAMAANPELKVLRVKDGNLLDEHSMKLLHDLADQEDYQVWIERVDTSGAVGIYMEDGAVAADNQK